MKIYSKLTLFIPLLILGSILIAVFYTHPLPVSAADVEYTLLEPGIPIITTSGGTKATATSFLQGFMQLAIGIAGALAVIMIIYGGIKYITAASGTGKAGGREIITNALLGFVMTIAAWVILYTVNPALVNLQLTMEKLPLGPAFETTTPATSTSAPTAGAMCSNCVQVPTSIPQKSVAQNGCKAPGPCVIHKDVAQKLLSLTSELQGKVTWQVTEMYPPTVPHKDSCHSNGTCVDAKLFAVTTGRLITFLSAVEKTFGMNYTYEVCGARLNTLRNDIQLAKFKARFSCPSTTTGESIHIEL